MFRKPTLDDLLDNGKDHYVALLRSFEDDEGRFEYWARLMGSFPTAHNPIPMRNDWRSFEETLSIRLGLYGPVIAVSSKGFFTPPGAKRVKGDSQRWFDQVKRLITYQCHIVVLVLATTEGLLDEFNALIEINQPKKLILAFPPVDSETLRERWDTLLQKAGGLDLPPSLDDRAMFATFSEDWECRFVLGDSFSRKGIKRGTVGESKLYGEYDTRLEEALKPFHSEIVEAKLVSEIYKGHKRIFPKTDHPRSWED